jgi:eukaryotic-like serine/threonine-protein kinase
MVDDPRVQELLDELLNSHATPEEVCGSCPELLPVVRLRWRRLRRVSADLNSLFPPEDDHNPRTSGGSDLPHIPGYEVEAVLGHGGMGVVFKARHLRLNRTVAIKTLLGGGFAGPRERERFQREAEAVAALRHPNVVQIFDISEEEGRPYFTMEFVEGGSLARKLAGLPQPAGPSSELVATLAEAVHAAHQGGILHRDLKPSNVLLATDGTPKISDFGLARRLEGEAALTHSGVPVGTPSYMAPEQALGGPVPVGKATDIYALGAILYELLTGRPPFRAATAAETVQQVISQEPVPPSRLNNRVPRDLETICLKCLHKEPARRYGNAAELADDLRRFREGRPILARPTGWAERSWRWCRRNPAAATLLVAAVALTGLASGGGVWFVQERARREAELRGDMLMAVTQAASFRKGLHFHEARQLLEQARQRLEAKDLVDLSDDVKQARADLDLAEKLDQARLRSTIVSEVLSPSRAEPLYVSAFEMAELGHVGNDTEAASTRVRDSALRVEIVAALDDWASVTQDKQRREWLLTVARNADPDEARNQIRRSGLWTDRTLWKDPARLKQLTRDLKEAELTPQLATALARVARANDGDEIALLIPVAARFPQDFWLQYDLGWALFGAHRKDESLGHFRATVALRPNASAAHQALGFNLKDLGQKDEAKFHFQEALRVGPNDAGTLNSFGMALSDWGELDEGIALLRQALLVEPDRALFHRNLGLLLLDKRSHDEAIEQLQQAVRLEPEYSFFRHGLIRAFLETGRLDEALVQAREVVQLDPTSGLNQWNLGAILRRKGRLEEAISHIRKAIKLDPNLQPALIGLGVTLKEAASVALNTSAEDSARVSVVEPKHAAKRRQAQEWLRENLALRARMLSEGKAVEWSIVDWLTDPALAEVRDATGLAKLPDIERVDWQLFWFDVKALVATDPGLRGPELAATRDWAKAVDCYSQASKSGPKDFGNFWFEYSALLLLSGDRTGYTRACALMIDQHGKPGGPRAYHVARACTLAPGSVADESLPGRLAERELRGYQEKFWSLTELGALACRTGRYQEAIALFERSIDADPRSGSVVINWLWLALANQKFDKPAEARRWLDKARAWLDQFKDGMPAGAERLLGLHLHNWLEAHILRREVEALLRPAGLGEDTDPVAATVSPE